MPTSHQNYRWLVDIGTTTIQVVAGSARLTGFKTGGKKFSYGGIVEILFTARHGVVSESAQETIKNKVAKLPRFFDRLTEIQVVADLMHVDSPKVEIIASAEHANDFFASDTGTNVVKALDSAMAKMEQQLKKHKEKLTAHRHQDHRDEG
ncbi:ribosome-associated translation inhibitor RaiA [Mariniblastus sp.]|nr:ribosome-associated translation inhibitor RaiA [Mariniblastus sp.]